MQPQAADPVVSQVKFDREIGEFQVLAEDYRRRGWFMAYADFPRVLLLATAPHLQPPAVVTGVLFDYTDYDFRPPSVRLVNPFTEVPYQMKELPTTLRRATEVDSVLPFGI